eukprot:gene7427-9470_t
MSREDWKEFLLKNKFKEGKFPTSGKYFSPEVKVAPAIDWRATATGALEGAFKLKYGTLTDFSAQWFVDCDTTNDGCEGGFMDNAFSFASDASHGGLCSSADYPYTS